MNCRENQYIFNPNPTGGLGVLGVTISKVRKMLWTVEKIDKKIPPGGGRELLGNQLVCNIFNRWIL